MSTIKKQLLLAPQGAQLIGLVSEISDLRSQMSDEPISKKSYISTKSTRIFMKLLTYAPGVPTSYPNLYNQLGLHPNGYPMS